MKRFNLTCAPSGTDMLYSIKEDRLLAYSCDFDAIHNLLGGKMYYSSWSGKTKEGFVNNLQEYIPVGSYSTSKPWEQTSVCSAAGLRVYIPWSPWKREIADEYPVIIKLERNIPQLIITSIPSLKETLKSVSLENGTYKIGGEVDEMEVQLLGLKIRYQVMGWHSNMPNPLCFLAEELASFELPQCQEEELFLLTGYAEDENKNAYRYMRVGNKLYKKELVEGDPFYSSAPELHNGWKLIETDFVGGVAYRYTTTEIEYLAWADPRDLAEKAALDPAIVSLPTHYRVVKQSFSKLGIDIPAGKTPEEMVKEALMKEFISVYAPHLLRGEN